MQLPPQTVIQKNFCGPTNSYATSTTNNHKEELLWSNLQLFYWSILLSCGLWSWSVKPCRTEQLCQHEQLHPLAADVCGEHLVSSESIHLCTFCYCDEKLYHYIIIILVQSMSCMNNAEPMGSRNLVIKLSGKTHSSLVIGLYSLFLILGSGGGWRLPRRDIYRE